MSYYRGTILFYCYLIRLHNTNNVVLYGYRAENMRPDYREMRLRQLLESLAPYERAKSEPRPPRGWLRAIREALGITLDQVGKSLGTTRQRIKRFELAEAQDRITLASLRRVADAMGCEVVYAIVPKAGTIVDLAETRARGEASKRVLAVEHTMALEDQAAGNLKETIAQETQRILKRQRSRAR
jgi:predicted DNA-binding mobile mystery protein A